MAKTVSLNNLDALLGLTFGQFALASLSATKVSGSIVNTAASPNQVLTYNGMAGTVGSAFIPMKSVTYQVTKVVDATNTLTIDAFVGKTLVGEMNFTVSGFSGAGIALVAMPLASLVTQAGNLPGLNGSVFTLGYNAAGAKGQSVSYSYGDVYSIIPNANVRYVTAAYPVLNAGAGPMVLIGLSGNDHITAGPGQTVIYGGPGNSVLTGGSGVNTIYAGSGNTIIWAGSGATTIYGGSGNDVMHGGSGRTTMIAGTGNDIFSFSPGDTGGLTPATADVVKGFVSGSGDVIRLWAFDPFLPPGGTGHLNFIGTAAFDGHAGEVRYDVNSTGVTVTGDMTGAGTPSFMIVLPGVTSLSALDFIL